MKFVLTKLGNENDELVDIVHNISPEHHDLNIVKEANYLGLIEIAFKHIERQMFSKTFTVHVRSKLIVCITGLVTLFEGTYEYTGGPVEGNRNISEI